MRGGGVGESVSMAVMCLGRASFRYCKEATDEHR